MFAVSYSVGTIGNRMFKSGFYTQTEAEQFIYRKTSACVWEILKFNGEKWVVV